MAEWPSPGRRNDEGALQLDAPSRLAPSLMIPAASDGDKLNEWVAQLTAAQLVEFASLSVIIPPTQQSMPRGGAGSCEGQKPRFVLVACSGRGASAVLRNLADMTTTATNLKAVAYQGASIPFAVPLVGCGWSLEEVVRTASPKLYPLCSLSQASKQHPGLPLDAVCLGSAGLYSMISFPCMVDHVVQGVLTVAARRTRWEKTMVSKLQQAVFRYTPCIVRLAAKLQTTCAQQDALSNPESALCRALPLPPKLSLVDMADGAIRELVNLDRILGRRLMADHPALMDPPCAAGHASATAVAEAMMRLNASSQIHLAPVCKALPPPRPSVWGATLLQGSCPDCADYLIDDGQAPQHPSPAAQPILPRRSTDAPPRPVPAPAMPAPGEAHCVVAAAVNHTQHMPCSPTSTQEQHCALGGLHVRCTLDVVMSSGAGSKKDNMSRTGASVGSPCDSAPHSARSGKGSDNTQGCGVGSGPSLVQAPTFVGHQPLPRASAREAETHGPTCDDVEEVDQGRKQAQGQGVRPATPAPSQGVAGPGGVTGAVEPPQPPQQPVPAGSSCDDQSSGTCGRVARHGRLIAACEQLRCHVLSGQPRGERKPRLSQETPRACRSGGNVLCQPGFGMLDSSSCTPTSWNNNMITPRGVSSQPWSPALGNALHTLTPCRNRDVACYTPAPPLAYLL